jgi:hypothetical protein
MTSDIISREQRLRMQAELQSLYTALTSLREREASYIEAAATIPEQFLNQISDIRQKIVKVESELVALEDEAVELQAQKLYRQGFEAELSGNFSKAVKLYRSAARYSHSDGNAAYRSVRHLIKSTKNRFPAGERWIPTSSGQSRNRLLLGLGVLVIAVLFALVALRGRSPAASREAVAIAPAATDTASPIPTGTSTPNPTSTTTNTPTATPEPTNTPQPPPPELPSPTPSLTDTVTPTFTPTLRTAPGIIGPRDGLVWGDGSIVFEFEDLDLAHDELYCLNTLRGYDITNTENWSFPPVGRKPPLIAIEPNPFHVAQARGIRCVVWSAFIAKETCDNVLSESTAERVIGLPRPCDFGPDGIP